jgi:hypothetical protein
VPTAPNQGNDKNSVLSHPLLEQQYAHFLDEQRKKGELRGADVSRALRIGGKSDDGAEGMGPPGTPVLSGVTGGLAGEGLSPENAHVIAREIARLQASRAEDAERLKALMQRKGGWGNRRRRRRRRRRKVEEEEEGLFKADGETARSRDKEFIFWSLPPASRHSLLPAIASRGSRNRWACLSFLEYRISKTSHSGIAQAAAFTGTPLN